MFFVEVQNNQINSNLQQTKIEAQVSSPAENAKAKYEGLYEEAKTIVDNLKDEKDIFLLSLIKALEMHNAFYVISVNEGDKYDVGEERRDQSRKIIRETLSRSDDLQLNGESYKLTPNVKRLMSIVKRLFGRKNAKETSDPLMNAVNKEAFANSHKLHKQIMSKVAAKVKELIPQVNASFPDVYPKRLGEIVTKFMVDPHLDNREKMRSISSK